MVWFVWLTYIHRIAIYLEYNVIQPSNTWGQLIVTASSMGLSLNFKNHNIVNSKNSCWKVGIDKLLEL